MDITRTVLTKNRLLKRIARKFNNYLTGEHLDFIVNSCTNIEEIRRLSCKRTIFVCLHQPFVYYIPVWLCEMPGPLSTIFRGLQHREFREELLRKREYNRYVYRPYVSLRALLSRLRSGENIILAADTRVGNHFYKIKFGPWNYHTPAGIYRLCNATGASMVPVFIHLIHLLPYPRFRLEIGSPYFFSKRPTDYDSSIEAMFSWFYSCMQKQPYMWNRISKMK